MDGLAQLEHVLGKVAFDKIRAAKVLVVGAGGIGCELLKNCVLSGLTDLEVIDLDTIDPSNLNRQVRDFPSNLYCLDLLTRPLIFQFLPRDK